MAGLTATTASTWTRARSRRGRTLWRARSRRILRWARTRPRWGLRIRREGPLKQLGPGLLVGQHGSWNRKPRSGYKVLFVPLREGRPAGEPVEVLGGFMDEDRDVVYGRPVGVALGKDGALLVADDVGNAIWRVGAF